MSDNIIIFEGDDKNIYLKILLYNLRGWFINEYFFIKNLVLIKISFVILFILI